MLQAAPAVPGGVYLTHAWDTVPQTKRSFLRHIVHYFLFAEVHQIACRQTVQGS